MITKKLKSCDADQPPPPPVPPRRRKKKHKDDEPERPSSVTTPRRKPERKYRAPPTPPQRTKLGRRTPSPRSETRSPATLPSLDSTASGYDSEDANAKPRSILSKRSRSNSPFEKPAEPNKYPPLCFTYQDYQMVMEESKPSKSSDKAFEENADVSIFMENVTFNNPREEIYFRVTTTSRPFEKCLEDWNKYDAFADDSNEEHSDLFIFENYLDRSNKLNARPHLLYTEEFSSGPENSACTERSTTRVRFLIESPSTSTPDADLDDDGKSYGEFIQRQLGDSETAKLVELTEEEVQKLNEELAASIERESEAARAENVSESLQIQNTNQTIDSCSDLEEDVELQSMNTVDPSKDDQEDIEELDEIYEKDKVKSAREKIEVEPRELKNEITKSVNQDPAQPLGESFKDQAEISIKTEIGDICERRQIYIDSSCYKLSNEDSEEWQIYYSKENATLDSLEELKILIDPTLSNQDDTIGQEPVINPAETVVEEKEAGVISKKAAPTIVISSDEEKPSACRNSFLDSMLGSGNNSSENSSVLNCEVIAAHPKQDTDRQQSKNTIEETATPVPRNGPRIESTALPGAPPKALPPITSEDNKSTGEVKSDMLNELLTNFNTIKLRPVGGETSRSKSKTEDVVKAEAESMADDSDSNLSTERGRSSTPSSIVSVEKSAIVKEAPYAERNDNNDNKAMTPVDVSNDQLRREDVSITPGSVRSFVKYYEINAEINNIAKIKDNLFRKQKELAGSKKKTESASKTEEKSKKTSRSGVSSRSGAKNEKKVSEKSKPPVVSPKPTVKQSCIKNSLTSSPNLERKKSVQFGATDTVINLASKEDQKKVAGGDEEGTISSFIGGIKTKPTVKSTTKSDVKKIETTKKLDQHPSITSSSAAVICIKVSLNFVVDEKVDYRGDIKFYIVWVSWIIFFASPWDTKEKVTPRLKIFMYSVIH